MPRAARKRSATDIYHVMLRGINRNAIFQDDEDHRRFLRTLSDCKQVSGFRLYAWCLMPNHIHLLVHVQKEPLELIIKRIGSRFVWWYNMKYERVGHLFQDRYRSEPVEDDTYFLTVLRYIMQNPVKAGLADAPGGWPWSSYIHYNGGEDFITDTAFADGLPVSPQGLRAVNPPKPSAGWKSPCNGNTSCSCARRICPLPKFPTSPAYPPPQYSASLKRNEGTVPYSNLPLCEVE